MGLTSFYKLIDNKIISFLSKKYNPKYNILICFVDDNKHFSKKKNITKIDIGNAIYFKENIIELNNKLGSDKYNIIDIRFSLEYFFKNSNDLLLLINFLNEHLSESGHLISYIINQNKLNASFIYGNNSIGKYLFMPKYDLTDSYHCYGNQIEVGREPFTDKIYTVDMDETTKKLNEINIKFLGKIKFSSFAQQYFESGGYLSRDDLKVILLCDVYLFYK